MEIPVHELYKFEGEEGPALDELKRAMDWLLSPAANGIGERLLRDAYALHHKPLTIKCGSQMQGMYSPPLELMENAPEDMKAAYDEYCKSFPLHGVIIDPRITQLMHFQTPAGEWDTLCLEAVLAHEMRHASQDHSERAETKLFQNEEMFQKHMQETFAFFEKLVAGAEQDQKYVKNTPYRITAEQRLRIISDTMFSPMLQHFTPKFTKEYIEKYETDTLAVEGEVQKLKGHAARTEYFDTNERVIEAAKNASLEEIKKQMGTLLDDKLGIPPLAQKNPDFWKNTIKDTTELKLTKWEPNPYEHPLIAKHEDGGRN